MCVYVEYLYVKFALLSISGSIKGVSTKEDVV
jgi:hypothetical protein